MAQVSLSTRDLHVLEKIKDPESDPNSNIVFEQLLPRDPHIVDAATYEVVVARERAIVRSIQDTEAQLSQARSIQSSEGGLQAYRQCLRNLSDLILDYPSYASARNNRAQVLRRLYGDAVLLNVSTTMPVPLIEEPELLEKVEAAETLLQDLEQSISLLSPASSTSPMSPQAARTLSLTYTQRAAVYLRTSKLLSCRQLALRESLRESRWSRFDFEEAASHDLAMGGRYGNEIAKGLAVSVNPTAKLCGQMVREAMKREYGETFV